MKIFNTIGHFLAWTIHAIVGGASEVGAVAQTVATDLQTPLAQFIAANTGKVGAQVQADIEAVAGVVVQAAGGVGAAAVANLLNVQNDTVAVQAIERLVSTIGGLFSKPAAAPAGTAK